MAAAAARLAFPAGVPRSPLRPAAAAQGAVRGPMQRTGEPLRFTGESARPVCLPTGPVAPCACSVYIPSGSPSALSGSPGGRCLSARSPRSLRGPRASLQESATVSPSPFPVPFGSPPCVPSAPRVPHVELSPSSMSPRVPYCVPPGPYFPPACPVPLTHAGPHTPAGCTPHHSIGCSAPVSPPSPPPSDPGLGGQRLLRYHPKSVGLREREGLRREGECCPTAWGFRAAAEPPPILTTPLPGRAQSGGAAPRHP